ncbi:MAG TPA: histidine kinase [Chitinophagaceae bacterium]
MRKLTFIRTVGPTRFFMQVIKKPLLLSVLSLLLLAGTSNTLKAQLPDFHLQVFDYTSGIQAGIITAVAKDKKGFLWILYQRQVQRFDGKQVTTYKLNDNFTHLLCDDEGNVWVSCYAHVMKYTDDTRAFREVKIKTTDTTIIRGPTFRMYGNKVWLLTTRAFYEYDKKNDEFTPITEKLPLPPPYSVRVFANYDNTLFIRRSTSLYRYDIVTKKLDSLPDLNINKPIPLSKDSVLISTWDNKSFWYDYPAKKTTDATVILPSGTQANSFVNARSMVEFSPHRFLIAGRDGIFEYDHAKKQFRHLNFYYNGRKVTANDYANYIFLDKDGYAWLSTIDGVARFALNRSAIGLLRIRQANDVLPTGIDNVRKIVEDNKGNIWLATANGLAWRSKEKQDWHFVLATEGRTDRLAHPSIRGLVFDGKYIIMAPTDLGVWLLDPVSNRFIRPGYDNPQTKQASEGDFFSHIETLRSGDHLFTGRDAIYLLNGKTYQFRKLSFPVTINGAACAFQDSKQLIWISSSRGLFLLDSSLNYIETVRIPVKNQVISGAFILPDDRLLFATDEGLYTADHKNGKTEIKKFTNLFDNIYLLSIYQDKQGIIWASSENGIYRFDPTTSKLNLFDHSDNVQGYGFNNNSWLRSRDGTLYFGGSNGINYLNPDAFTLADDSLKLYIYKAVVGNNDTSFYSFDQKPSLKYSQRSLEVEFATAYFNNPGKVKYRYRLVGYDDNWYNTGNNNTVRFTSLSPGNYKLEVQASLNTVDWVDAQNSFSFRIASPFWQKWWFYVLFATTLATVFYLLIKSRNKQIQEKQEELEAEQAINYFASSMSEQQAVENILWDVARNCIGRLQFEDCVIYLLDEKEGMLIQKAGHGRKSPQPYQLNRPIGIPLGKGIVGSVALSGKAEIIRDTTKDLRYIVDGERRLSEIAVPIISDGKVLGVIDCEHSKKGFFSQKHLSILTTIASLCANKIVRAKAEEEKTLAQQVLIDTKQKMADAEMQALRAQMNPHFIFNCLNSINRYIVKSDQATASLYLTRFAKLIRLILDNSNSKNVNLANELEALKLYIEMEMLRFDKKFSYSVTIDDTINPDSIELPPLIIQPYVENAIWHGLLHKETGGNLSVHISMNGDNMLVCQIEDDGVGREKEMELKSKSATTRKSLGMKLTEDRISLLNKHAELNASVDIIDLHNGNGEAKGTKVILKIPI